MNGLSPFETLGVWLSGDYRFGTGTPAIAYLLIALAAVLAAVGAVAAARRRALGPLLAAGTAVLVWLVLPAGIYIEAKLLAIASPPLVLLAMGGADAVTRERRLRVAGILAAAAVAAAVLVSDGMAIRDAYIAPKDRLDELREVGERFAGTGPAMLDEFEEYGKYFLRDSNAITPFDGYALLPAELRVPGPTYDTWADLDELTLEYVEEYPLIVRRRNPVASRPPSNYRRVFLGDYYEVWRARGDAPKPLDHLSLGDAADPTGAVDCAAVRQAAARPGAGALVAAQRRSPLQLRAADMTLPAGWPVLPNGSVGALRAGTLRGELTAPAGRYRVWVRGTFGRGADVLVDGRTVGRADQVQTREQMALAGEVEVRDGSHEIRLVRGGPAPLPGNGRDESYDAVFLEPVAPVVLRRVTSDRASALCGTRADWVESLSR